MVGVKRSEAEVAQVVMNWMTGQLWDCYPEVELPGGRADIVGVRPFPFMPHRQCVHIVECKTSWTLTLLEQAQQRLRYAHFVSIAAPTRMSSFYKQLALDMGLGVIKFYGRADLTIDEYGIEHGRMCRHVFNRNRRFTGEYRSGPEYLLTLLDEDMKNYAPGTSSGYSSPWRRTMDRCVKFVQANPGCTVKDIIESIDHHYASKSGAKQGVLLWLQKREEISVSKKGNAICFYPK